MLKKRNRLQRPVPLSGSTTRTTPFFSLRYKTHTEHEQHIQVVVSKKVSKKAVERNRVKRLMTSYIEQHMGHWQKFVDMTIFTKHTITTVTQDEVYKTLDYILQKEGIQV